MAYAIMRTKKLKTPANVAAAASHIERTRPTHNANLDIQNEWLTKGGAGMYDRAQKVWDKIPKKRSDAVHGFEVLMTLRLSLRRGARPGDMEAPIDGLAKERI